MEDINLESIDYYANRLKRYRATHKHHRHLKMRIECKINRHKTSNGYNWGWYEVFPLNLIAGYWDSETNRDDLKHIDIKKWNQEAQKY